MIQWVETILHQFKDVGIVDFLVRTLQSTNQRMYLYLLFLQMAPLCSGCCGRTCENWIQNYSTRSIPDRLEILGLFSGSWRTLKISRKPNADTHSSTTQKPLRVFAKKKPIALCALWLRGALPHPPISMLLSPHGPGLQESFFFSHHLCTREAQANQHWNGGRGRGWTTHDDLLHRLFFRKHRYPLNSVQIEFQHASAGPWERCGSCQ